MPVVSRDCPSFSGLAWTCDLLPIEHTQASIYNARPFASAFYIHLYCGYKIQLKCMCMFDFFKMQLCSVYSIIILLS